MNMFPDFVKFTLLENSESNTSDSTSLLMPKCIYCGKSATDEHPMLFRVYAPGTYYQHWDFDSKGCDENQENISPNGLPSPKIT